MRYLGKITKISTYLSKVFSTETCVKNFTSLESLDQCYMIITIVVCVFSTISSDMESVFYFSQQQTMKNLALENV